MMNIWVLILILLSSPILFFLFPRKRNKLPPGSLGIPLIGQSFALLRAMRSNTADKWIGERAQKYGPISKMNLFGKPTVFMFGQAANKFIFSTGANQLSNHQTDSVRRILGDRCLLQLTGDDHKRLRNALFSFLKPDCLKNYVPNIENEIRSHLTIHWQGKHILKVLPLMKTLTFNIICSTLFGIQRGERRDSMVGYFQQMIEGMWSIPLNLPFTRFNRSLKATAKVRQLLTQLIAEKRMELEMGCDEHQDLITSLLSIRDDDGNPMVSEDEIVHNVALVMVAGHDTSSVLITFILRILAKHKTIYHNVVKEQEQIKKSKGKGECLTWDDVAKMKYTWRVAMEILRTTPPVFGGFRKAIEDIEYEGYLIPKGWQVFWVSSMTHMDSDIFPQPWKFDPDRFLDPISSYCYIPFGGGARICPGYEFAKIETLITIHCLVTQFEWKLCGRDDGFIRDPMPTPTQGLPIQISPLN